MGEGESTGCKGRWCHCYLPLGPFLMASQVIFLLCNFCPSFFPHTGTVILRRCKLCYYVACPSSPPSGWRAHSEQTNPHVMPTTVLLPAVSVSPHWALFLLNAGLHLPSVCSALSDSMPSGFHLSVTFQRNFLSPFLSHFVWQCFSPLLHAHFSLLLVLI